METQNVQENARWFGVLETQVTTTSKRCNREPVHDHYREHGFAWGVCDSTTGRLLVINKNVDLARDWIIAEDCFKPKCPKALVRCYPSRELARAEADRRRNVAAILDTPLSRRISSALLAESNGGAA
jgi:hypothetical protein